MPVIILQFRQQGGSVLSHDLHPIWFRSSKNPKSEWRYPVWVSTIGKKGKNLSKTWAKALKQYIAAGMTQEQITAMREFDEELFRQERVYENRINVGLPDLNIQRFSVEEDYFQDLSHHLDAAMENLCPGSSQKVTDQDRKVVLLACTGLKQEEIAVILHISQMSVYSLYYSAASFLVLLYVMFSDLSTFFGFFAFG